MSLVLESDGFIMVIMSLVLENDGFRMIIMSLVLVFSVLSQYKWGSAVLSVKYK
jgi:hypothetical protein